MQWGRRVGTYRSHSGLTLRSGALLFGVLVLLALLASVKAAQAQGYVDPVAGGPALGNQDSGQDDSARTGPGPVDTNEMGAALEGASPISGVAPAREGETITNIPLIGDGPNSGTGVDSAVPAGGSPVVGGAPGSEPSAATASPEAAPANGTPNMDSSEVAPKEDASRGTPEGLLRGTVDETTENLSGGVVEPLTTGVSESAEPVTRPAGDLAGGTVQGAGEKVGTVTTPVGESVGKALEPVGAVSEGLASRSGEALEPATSATGAALTPLTGPVTEKVSDPIGQQAGDVAASPVGDLQEAASPLTEDLVGPLNGVANGVSQATGPFVEPAANVAGPTAENVTGTVRPVTDPVKKPVAEFVAPAVEPVAGAVSPVTRPLSPAVEPLEPVAEPVEGAVLPGSSRAPAGPAPDAPTPFTPAPSPQAPLTPGVFTPHPGMPSANDTGSSVAPQGLGVVSVQPPQPEVSAEPQAIQPSVERSVQPPAPALDASEAVGVRAAAAGREMAPEPRASANLEAAIASEATSAASISREMSGRHSTGARANVVAPAEKSHATAPHETELLPAVESGDSSTKNARGYTADAVVEAGITPLTAPDAMPYAAEETLPQTGSYVHSVESDISASLDVVSEAVANGKNPLPEASSVPGVVAGSLPGVGSGPGSGQGASGHVFMAAVLGAIAMFYLAGRQVLSTSRTLGPGIYLEAPPARPG